MPVKLFRLLLALCLGLALASGPARSGAAEPYEIDVLLPLTGAATFIGHGMAAGIAAAEAVVNRTGGIGGRPVKFVVQDDQSNPQIDVQLANAAIAKNHVILMGAALVAQCNAMTPLTKDGPVLYCLTPGVHPPDGSFVFSIDPSTSDVIPVSVRYFRERGFTRFAVITSTDATGQDAEHGIDTAFALPENSSISIVDREHFNTTDVSVSAQMAHVKASNAQVLIAWSTGTPLGTLLRGALESGLDLPILTTNGNLTYAQMTQYAQILPRELYFPGFACVVPDEVTDKAVRAAVGTYVKELVAEGVRPEYMPSTSYDPALIVVAALRKLGPDATAAQLRDYIANLHGFAGATGPYDFRATPQRGLGQNAVLVVRWDKGKGTWLAMSKPGGTPLASR
jgi:branched-chain amino acid transport system substrate-binding protein